MKQSKTVKAACDLLISRVRFETAQFPPPGDRWTNKEEYTVEVREATRLYTETWIVPLLNAIRDGDTYRLQEAVRRGGF